MSQRNPARRALIVGGGSGIGEETARLMHSRGWQVSVADIDGTAAQAIAKALGGEGTTLDVTDETAVEDLADSFGAPDALIITAAVFQPVAPPAEFPTELWERTLRVNLTGTWLCARAFGTRMAAVGRGSIVAISSIAALGSSPVHAYAASKIGVAHLVRGLAGEWGRSGVRVNAVSPGSTLVPRVVERIAAGRYADHPGAFTALGRAVEPNEVAEAIEFLASPRASAITGVNLVVDAGWDVASTWVQYGGVRPPASGA